jgi:predicted RNA-binding protein with PUA-like domain
MARERYWLVKSEPDVYSIDDLARDGSTSWEGVRNYQARNFLREMREGDAVLFYHSNARPSGVAGIARVAREAYPDPTALDRRSEYFDPKATEADPRWSTVDLAFVERFPEVLPLARLQAEAALAGMELLRRGSRLSVQPVGAPQFRRVVALARGDAPTR